MIVGDLDALGLHASLLMAGFAGGAVSVVARQGPLDFRSICSGIIAGTLTGNYLAGAAKAVFPMIGTGAEIGAFAIGVCGIEVCRRLMRRAAAFNTTENSQ